MSCVHRMTTVNAFGILLALSLFALTSCGPGSSGGTPPTTTTPSATSGTTVQVSVAAQDGNDTNPDQLHYRWAATEGTIDNVDKPTTSWTIPSGSGLQFAYVLVSDSKGGYAESRAAALTFGSVNESAPISITPPPPSQPAHGYAWGTLFYQRTESSRQVYLPGVSIQINGQLITTDLKGEFFIPNLPFGSHSATFTLPGGQSGSFSVPVTQGSLPTSPAASSFIRVPVTGSALRITGHVSLADGSLCGIRNEFFTQSNKPNFLSGPQSATAQLLDATNNPLSSIVSVNHYGDFFVTLDALSEPTNARLQVRCEQAPNKIVDITVPALGDFVIPQTIIIDSLPIPPTPNKRPIITGMTITLGGRDIGRPDLPRPRTLLPEMDLAPGDDAFLTFKGIDTRKGACAYYHKIGAVESCDAEGYPIGAQLTLDQWRKQFNLSPFHDGDPAEPEFKAIYVNKQDLNLTRDMQGIKLNNRNGAPALAYNVCNYPGPQDVNSPIGTPKLIGEETQADINLAIENTKRGIGKVVCVAMDYSVTPGLNNGNPFIKFYTFSPSGKLLLSVSLDGRREKFMPGSCVACHGGDNYGGKFPDDYSPTNPTGTGQANLGSYFLPFDVANFYFSTSDPSLSRDTLLLPLRQMNELLASTDNPTTQPITDDLKTLITTRWYPLGNTDNEQTEPAPEIYTTQNCQKCHANYDARDTHRIAIAPACQICHTSNAPVPDAQFTFRIGVPSSPRITFVERPPSHYLSHSGISDPPISISGPRIICGGGPDMKANHTMPNALGSFERFWLKKDFDQPASLFLFHQADACSVVSSHPDL